MGIFFKSKKQREAEKIGPSLLQTAQECAAKVNTTKNPDTFFQNYEKMVESLSALAKIQYSLKIKGQLPSDILRTIKDKKPFTIEEFLARYYTACADKLAKQKDTAYKEKIVQRFTADLQPYLQHFAQRNIKQLQTYYTELHQQILTKEN